MTKNQEINKSKIEENLKNEISGVSSELIGNKDKYEILDRIIMAIIHNLRNNIGITFNEQESGFTVFISKANNTNDKNLDKENEEVVEYIEIKEEDDVEIENKNEEANPIEDVEINITNKDLYTEELEGFENIELQINQSMGIDGTILKNEDIDNEEDNLPVIKGVEYPLLKNANSIDELFLIIIKQIEIDNKIDETREDLSFVLNRIKTIDSYNESNKTLMDIFSNKTIINKIIDGLMISDSILVRINFSIKNIKSKVKTNGKELIFTEDNLNIILECFEYMQKNIINALLDDENINKVHKTITPKIDSRFQLTRNIVNAINNRKEALLLNNDKEEELRVLFYSEYIKPLTTFLLKKIESEGKVVVQSIEEMKVDIAELSAYLEGSEDGIREINAIFEDFARLIGNFLLTVKKNSSNYYLIASQISVQKFKNEIKDLKNIIEEKRLLTEKATAKKYLLFKKKKLTEEEIKVLNNQLAEIDSKIIHMKSRNNFIKIIIKKIEDYMLEN